ncbi:hypothetical protein [Erwinia sp. 9145]|uniref:hypothetical protein n=1 Tax=Erwinia sp. 9145 TaxID=1500895 RepID=UPI000556DCA5|nr:hypothetical protein [Erwinia sp. 9145]
MAMNYLRLRAKSKRLLTENGMQYSVIRKGKVTVVAGKEIKEPDSIFTAVGVRTEYAPSEIDGSLIKAGDTRIVFSADTDLVIGDMVLVDEKQYRIVQPNPVKPASLVLCYKAQLRA